MTKRIKMFIFEIILLLPRKQNYHKTSDRCNKISMKCLIPLNKIPTKRQIKKIGNFGVKTGFSSKYIYKIIKLIYLKIVRTMNLIKIYRIEK